MLVTFCYSTEYVNRIGGNPEKKYGDKHGRRLTGLQIRILNRIHYNPAITIRELADVLEVSMSAIDKNTRALRETGILSRTGSARSGRWEIHHG